MQTESDTSMCACIDRMCGSSVCVRTSVCYLSMDLPSGRTFLRFGKLKSNFFKEFSQNQCIIAHTLQDPVRTNCRFENVENETTQHKLYTHWRNYTYNSQCLYPQLQSGIIFNRIFSVYTNTCSVSGTSKTKFFVADINIKCNGVHCMRAAGENVLEVH